MALIEEEPENVYVGTIGQKVCDAILGPERSALACEVRRVRMGEPESTARVHPGEEAAYEVSGDN